MHTTDSLGQVQANSSTSLPNLTFRKKSSIMRSWKHQLNLSMTLKLWFSEFLELLSEDFGFSIEFYSQWRCGPQRRHTRLQGFN